MHWKDVYISHWPEDEAVAEAACSALEEAGLTCWFTPRDDWPIGYDGRPVQPLTRCSAMLSILSADSYYSGSLYTEARKARERGTPIMALRLAEPQEWAASEMTSELADERYDALTPEEAADLRPLADRIKQMLARDRERRERESQRWLAGLPEWVEVSAVMLALLAILAGTVWALIWIVP